MSERSRELDYYQRIRTGGYYWLVTDDGTKVEVFAQRTGARETLSKADFDRRFRKADGS